MGDLGLDQSTPDRKGSGKCKCSEPTHSDNPPPAAEDKLRAHILRLEEVVREQRKQLTRLGTDVVAYRTQAYRATEEAANRQRFINAQFEAGYLDNATGKVAKDDLSRLDLTHTGLTQRQLKAMRRRRAEGTK